MESWFERIPIYGDFSRLPRTLGWERNGQQRLDWVDFAKTWEIDNGGLSCVYGIENSDNEKQYALKIPTEETLKRYPKIFLNGLEQLAKCRHRNIIRVRGFGEYGGYAFFFNGFGWTKPCRFA